MLINFHIQTITNHINTLLTYHTMFTLGNSLSGISHGALAGMCGLQPGGLPGGPAAGLAGGTAGMAGLMSAGMQLTMLGLGLTNSQGGATSSLSDDVIKAPIGSSLSSTWPSRSRSRGSWSPGDTDVTKLQSYLGELSAHHQQPQVGVRSPRKSQIVTLPWQSAGGRVPWQRCRKLSKQNSLPDYDTDSSQSTFGADSLAAAGGFQFRNTCPDIPETMTRPPRPRLGISSCTQCMLSSPYFFQFVFFGIDLILLHAFSSVWFPALRVILFARISYSFYMHFFWDFEMWFFGAVFPIQWYEACKIIIKSCTCLYAIVWNLNCFWYQSGAWE